MVQYIWLDCGYRTESIPSDLQTIFWLHQQKGIAMESETEHSADPGRSWQRDFASDGTLLAAAVLDQVEAARFLRVQPRTLESWRQRRTGPRFIRYSQRCVRYRPSDLQAWLDARAVGTPPMKRAKTIIATRAKN